MALESLAQVSVDLSQVIQIVINVKHNYSIKKEERSYGKRILIADNNLTDDGSSIYEEIMAPPKSPEIEEEEDQEDPEETTGDTPNGLIFYDFVFFSI